MKVYVPSAESFGRRKERAIVHAANIAKAEARSIAEHEEDACLVSGRHHHTEALAVLQDITFEDLLKWHRDAFQNLYVEMFVYGNFKPEDVRTWGGEVATRLACVTSSTAVQSLKEEFPRARMAELPFGAEWQLCVDHPNSGEKAV